MPDKACLILQFYIMSFVDGRLFLDPSLPDTSAEQRAAIYQDMCGARMPLQRSKPSHMHASVRELTLTLKLICSAGSSAAASSSLRPDFRARMQAHAHGRRV
jgi:hypothetical protein